MGEQFTRRTAIKIFAAGTMATSTSRFGIGEEPSRSDFAACDDWKNARDRVWLGAGFWANPMEDWVLKNGAAECFTCGPQRSVHSLIAELVRPANGFRLSVKLQQSQRGQSDGGAGFRIGCRSEIDEYRSNCFARNGIVAGIIGDQLVLGERSVKLLKASTVANETHGENPKDGKSGWITLNLVSLGNANDNRQDIKLRLEAYSDLASQLIGTLEGTVPHDELRGNVALVSNFGMKEKSRSIDRRPSAQEESQGTRYRFKDWTLAGDGFEVHTDRAFGPILWAMYSLSDSRSDEGFVLKLSGIVAPFGTLDDEANRARKSREGTTTSDATFLMDLQIKRNAEWHSVGKQALDRDSWVATFRVPNWEESRQFEYRLVLEHFTDRHAKTESWDTFQGTIQANPTGRPLRMAAMTCQNDYAFPYQPVVNNLQKLKPDLAFFSGDQIYESHGGFGIVREPAERAILCYLRKFYQFGWAFRDLMRDTPTLCLPDDHDVLQGNLWGEGGAEMQNPERDPGASVLGGYVEPVRVVNAVHRTNCAHHPDPFDATPTARGIGVYFGDMVYGNVGFAILADRQWKSDPERVGAVVGRKYGDDVDPQQFDRPGLVLLGERQEAFLKTWASDWRGHELKAVLSQTLFSCLSTHQPRPDRFLRFDFDSNSWPQAARNRAVDILRKSEALHICGDTHLATLSQYGVNKQRDANWAFCSPAIAAGWPRWWTPDVIKSPVTNRPKHGLANTGEYLDAFNNKTYVYAVGNPVVGKSPNRYEKAHEKASGFGMVTFDPVAQTYTIEAYRFLVDATDGKKGNQFPGWPVVISRRENAGQNQLR